MHYEMSVCLLPSMCTCDPMCMSAFSKCDSFALSSIRKNDLFAKFLRRKMQKGFPKIYGCGKNIMMMSLYPLWLYRWLKKLSAYVHAHTLTKSAENPNLNFICLPNHFFPIFFLRYERILRQFRKLGEEETQLQSQWQWGNMRNF